MFSPRVDQDHLRVPLATATPLTGAEGNRSFFPVTSAGSYSVFMKKEDSFNKSNATQNLVP